MLTINENNKVDAREIYNFIGVKSRFNDWFKNSIDFIGAKESENYWMVKSDSTGGRPQINYSVTFELAILFCSMYFRSAKKSVELYKYLTELKGKEVLIKPRTRKELLFEINLNDILKDITTIIPQYSILSYRIDFYLPDLNIVIEYNEKYHSSISKRDSKRRREIENELHCDFIIVSEDCELNGINQLLKMILYKSLSGYEFTEDLSELGKDFLESFNIKTKSEIEHEFFAKLWNEQL